MNKNILFVMVLSWVLAGCASGGQSMITKNDCEGDLNNKVMIKIGYGDSYLEATPKSNIKRMGEIVYKLEPKKNQPSGIDYTGMVVTIKGKRDPEDQWLNKVAAAGTGNNKIYICVPVNQPHGEYGFNVTVEKVGTIDPRVEVKN